MEKELIVARPQTIFPVLDLSKRRHFELGYVLPTNVKTRKRRSGRRRKLCWIWKQRFQVQGFDRLGLFQIYVGCLPCFVHMPKAVCTDVIQSNFADDLDVQEDLSTVMEMFRVGFLTSAHRRGNSNWRACMKPLGQ